MLFRRPYAVVSFPEENDAMFVVPVSWLSNSTDTTGLYSCRWPKDNAQKASRKLKDPSDDWETHKAHVVHFSSMFFLFIYFPIFMNYKFVSGLLAVIFYFLA